MSKKLIAKIKACTHCAKHLPFSPNPVVSFSNRSKIVIIGQAPGIKVHDTGIPWNDASGVRLRQWLAVTKEGFYDTANFAITPMGFCYPGKGRSGDLPPRPECAPLWMPQIRKKLKHKKLTILIGQYAQKYFLPSSLQKNLTETVKHWQDYLPEYFVLPHPSPRNNIWLRNNPWFEKHVIKHLQKATHKILNS